MFVRERGVISDVSSMIKCSAKREDGDGRDFGSVRIICVRALVQNAAIVFGPPLARSERVIARRLEDNVSTQ